MLDTKTLREEFATLHKASNDLLTLTATEKRAMTGEEKQADEARFSRMEQIKAQIDQSKKLAEFSLINGEAELPTTPKGKAEFDAERTGKIEFNADAYRAAVNHFCRTGDVSKVQQFAITSGTQSGVFLPKAVAAPVNIKRLPNAIRALLAFYGVPALAGDLAQSLSLPVGDDTANVGQSQSESATSGTTADPSFSGSLTLNPNLYSSKQIWLSNTMVLGQSFDVLGYILPQLSTRVDKVQEASWVTALKTSGTVGKTTASPTTFTYAEWLAFEHSLGASYRSRGGFILSDSAYMTLRGLVDNNNRPLIDLDPQSGFMTTIHGKPIIISDQLDAIAASKTIGAFASVDGLFAYDAGQQRLARYVNDSQHPDQTGFELFSNGDFGFINKAVSLFATHA